ncbi:hypothetical protein BOX15_Mlig013942g2, partial [Macrostomum lignano]
AICIAMLRFGRHKSPRDLVLQLQSALRSLLQHSSSDSREFKRAHEEVAKSIASLKLLLTNRLEASGAGSSNRESHEAAIEKSRLSEALSEVTRVAFSQECSGFLPMLLDCIDRVDFECAKFIEHLFGNLLSKQIGNRYPAVEYILENRQVLYKLVDGYHRPEHAITFGGMLREACRHERVAEAFLWDSSGFYRLFDHVHGTAFDVSSDAFTTLKDLLTRHKAVVARFLEQNYVEFFDNYKRLIESENYVTKRQALKLLGEILLDRYNYSVMTKYIASADNLKPIMNALKSRQKQIAFEAFHCFKVFVANPHKPRAVQSILVQNRDRLVEFLQRFQSDRQSDSQFVDEKQYLIRQIQELSPIEA